MENELAIDNDQWDDAVEERDGMWELPVENLATTEMRRELNIGLRKYPKTSSFSVRNCAGR